jgi:hypothetical protein
MNCTFSPLYNRVLVRYYLPEFFFGKTDHQSRVGNAANAALMVPSMLWIVDDAISGVTQVSCLLWYRTNE